MPQPAKPSYVLTVAGKKKVQDALSKIFLNGYTCTKVADMVGLNRGTFSKILAGKQGVNLKSLDDLFSGLKELLEREQLALEQADYKLFERPEKARPTHHQKQEEAVDVPDKSSEVRTAQTLEIVEYGRKNADSRIDWGEAIDVSVFYGRIDELTTLQQWIVKDKCRLVAMLGIGGVGKTALSVKLAQQLEGEFRYIIWRSLRESPPVEKILADLIKFLSNQQETNLPDTVGERITRLIHYLYSCRCLLVLDNAESILQGGVRTGQYREGYDGYGDLLRRVGESSHQSCLLLTSREKPTEVAVLECEALSVRALSLKGLQENAPKILRDKGLSGSEPEMLRIAELYNGNPLALKIVSTSIKELFSGSVSEFLSQGTAVFNGVRALLDQQFNRLSDLEKSIMYWLAINREPVGVTELREDILPPVTQPRLLESLEYLKWRSLIEKSEAGFTLQNVLMEYMTERFIEQASSEITTGNFELFKSYALIKATAKDYVRETQVRLILKPVTDSLILVETRLIASLKILQHQSQMEPGYAAGNILNFLCYITPNLSGYDFSRLTIRQAYLQGKTLHNINFAHSTLVKCVFTDTLSTILSVAFSPDGRLLATGDGNDEVRLWQATDGKQLVTCSGHTAWVQSVAFSPDSQTLASGSEDHTIRLWYVSTNQCLKTLQGHDNRVRSVAFSPDSQTLASGSDDRTVKLWNVYTGECKQTLRGHIDQIHSVAFSPDGQTLASGSFDNTVRLWCVSTNQCFRTLQEHSERVAAVAFSPDGQTLASGSFDNTIRLWHVSTGQCFRTLQGHTDTVKSVSFSPKGTTLASGSDDNTVRLWDVNIGQCLKTLYGHSAWVSAVSINSQDALLASSSVDNTVRLWDISTGQCLKTLQGYNSSVRSVAFSPEGTTLAGSSVDNTLRIWNISTAQSLRAWQGHNEGAHSVSFSPQGTTLGSGGDDNTVKLWDVRTGQCLKILRGHISAVISIAFSRQGTVLASGSDDQTVKLWDIHTGECLKTLCGHSSKLFSVAFSPLTEILASSSDDQTVKLWDIHTGECLRTLRGHSSGVFSVAFSLKGLALLSASDDHTIRLWDIKTGECRKIWRGHKSGIRQVAVSPQGNTIASASDDHTVKLWDIKTGKCLKTLKAHTHWVWSVAFSANGQMLASGSEDETIKLWDVNTGECLKSLRSDRPYEGMNITNITGLTEETIATLKALGAFEQECE